MKTKDDQKYSICTHAMMQGGGVAQDHRTFYEGDYPGLWDEMVNDGLFVLQKYPYHDHLEYLITEKGKVYYDTENNKRR